MIPAMMLVLAETTAAAPPPPPGDPDGITALILGPLGALALALFVCWKLYKKLEDRDAALVAAAEKVTAAKEEARVTERALDAKLDSTREEQIKVLITLIKETQDHLKADKAAQKRLFGFLLAKEEGKPDAARMFLRNPEEERTVI